MQLLIIIFNELGFFCYGRTGESALGYGEVAEEAVKQYNPRKAHIGRFASPVFYFAECNSKFKITVP